MGNFSIAVPVFVALSCYGSMNGCLFALSRYRFFHSGGLGLTHMYIKMTMSKHLLCLFYIHIRWSGIFYCLLICSLVEKALERINMYTNINICISHIYCTLWYNGWVSNNSRGCGWKKQIKTIIEGGWITYTQVAHMVLSIKYSIHFHSANSISTTELYFNSDCYRQWKVRLLADFSF